VRKHAGPESITTAGDYGFRARRAAAPQNDDREFVFASVTARRANVPHAVGLNLPPNQWLPLSVLLPQEGRFAIVTSVGSGMRWTRYRSRRMLVSRTAKSCGPGLPTLRLSFAR